MVDVFSLISQKVIIWLIIERRIEIEIGFHCRTLQNKANATSTRAFCSPRASCLPVAKKNTGSR